ncbi:MAG: leucine-rich repeat domain-containing protein, partial [Firmicutes bacterium]|nr:leucine-rich repeat domain-containing protein [Bacillota bacterium]
MNGVTWTYSVLPEGGASIVGVDRIPENGLLVLPFQVEGEDGIHDVTEIGPGAFHGSFDMCVQFDQLLQHLVIPDTVTRIGQSAFAGCTKLTTVKLSSNLQTIESNAFSSCPIKGIQFPDSLSFIGGGAFRDTDLSSVTIPSSADFVMSNGAFWECPDLTEFIVPEANPNYIAVGGVIYSQDRRTLVAYPCGRDDPAFAVPEGVTALNETAFHYSKLQEVLLPDSLTTIGASAFYRCEQLTSVHVPEGVQKLEQACFGYCERLTDVELPSTLTSIGSHAFRSCQALQNLTIPDSVTDIKEYAFFEMTVQDSLAIPDNVTKIDYATFYYMVNLEELYLPEV